MEAPNLFTFYTNQIITKSDGENYYISGYVSTEDKDLVNDVVTKNCLQSMNSQLKDRNVKLDYDHESLRGKTDFDKEVNKTKEPLGRLMEPEIDSKGLKVTAILNKGWQQKDPDGRITKNFGDVWKSIQNGFLDAFSIAFIPKKISFNKSGSIRLLDDLDLINVALTGNPVNTAAKATSFGIRGAIAKSIDYLEEHEVYNHDFDAVSQEIKSLKEEVVTLKEQIKIYGAEVKCVTENADKPETEQKSQAQEKDKALEDMKSVLEIKSKENTELQNVIQELKAKHDELTQKVELLQKSLQEPFVKGIGSEVKEEKPQLKSVSDALFICK